MKVSKETRQHIIEQIFERPNITKDEVVDELKERGEFPDIEALIEQEFGRTANRLISRARDELGNRSIYATNGKGEYCNIDVSFELPKVQAVTRQLTKRAQGTAASVRKSQQREMVIEEHQLSLLDEASSDDSEK